MESLEKYSPEKRLAIGQTIFTSTFSGGAVVGLVGGADHNPKFWLAGNIPGYSSCSRYVLWFIIAKFIRIADPASIDTGIKVTNDDNNIKSGIKIDLKGTLALAATIITFLAGITLLEGNSYGEVYKVIGLFIASGISLTAFVIIEKRVYSPLLDFNLMRNKSFLAPTIILMLVFMSIFIVYSDDPYHGKKSASIWIWRQCNYSRKGTVAIYDCSISWNNHVRLYFKYSQEY